MLQFVHCLVNQTGKLQNISMSKALAFASQPALCPSHLVASPPGLTSEGAKELGTNHVDTFAQQTLPHVSSQLLTGPGSSPSGCVLWSVVWKSGPHVLLMSPIRLLTCRQVAVISPSATPVLRDPGPDLSTFSSSICELALMKAIHHTYCGDWTRYSVAFILGQ